MDKKMRRAKLEVLSFIPIRKAYKLQQLKIFQKRSSRLHGNGFPNLESVKD